MWRSSREWENLIHCEHPDDCRSGDIATRRDPHTGIAIFLHPRSSTGNSNSYRRARVRAGRPGGLLML